MKKLFERTMDNLDVCEPTEDFRKRYCPGDWDEPVVYLAYVGYIECLLNGSTQNDLAFLIGMGVGTVKDLVNLFAENKHICYYNLVDRRYTMAILSSSVLSRLIWTDRMAADYMSRHLMRSRVQLEAYIENYTAGKPSVALEYITSMNVLTSSTLLWQAAQKRLEEIDRRLFNEVLAPSTSMI